MYGFEWLDQTYRRIQEDRRDDFMLLLSMFPVARTAFDPKGARATDHYQRDLRRMLMDLTPWDQHGSVRSAYRKKVKSGTIGVVLDDPRLAKDPLFAGAKVVK